MRAFRLPKLSSIMWKLHAITYISCQGFQAHGTSPNFAQCSTLRGFCCTEVIASPLIDSVSKHLSAITNGLMSPVSDHHLNSFSVTSPRCGKETEASESTLIEFQACVDQSFQHQPSMPKLETVLAIKARMQCWKQKLVRLEATSVNSILPIVKAVSL